MQGIAHGGFGGVGAENFTYDALNRLTSVEYGSTPGRIDYGYDRYGNLLRQSVDMTAGSTDAASFRFNAADLAAHNRLPGGAGFVYDARGNLVSRPDPATGSAAPVAGLKGRHLAGPLGFRPAGPADGSPGQSAAPPWVRPGKFMQSPAGAA